MSPPRRRSARIRGRGESPQKSKDATSTRLTSLIERDETPINGVESTLDTIVSSPVVATPQTAGRIAPSREEMHPSKAHHSTATEPDSGLRLGFVDISKSAAPIVESPSKKSVASSPFDFRFAKHTIELGPEAQRMMEELRGEALRIKAKLAAERDEETRKVAVDDQNMIGNRKIAQPKGKVGRFSNVHLAEFKKMDSIAGHPSAFRGHGLKPPTSSQGLKRTKSKAQLDDHDNGSIMKSSTSTTQTLDSEEGTPAKRSKQVGEFVSSAHSPLKGKLTTPTIPRSRSGILESLTTPTQASLARAATVKHSSSYIPTLTRSPSKHSLTPSISRSAVGNNNLAGLTRSESSHKFVSTSTKLGHIPSFLRPTHASSERSAATTINTPQIGSHAKKMNLEKDLPAIPTSAQGISFQAVKHVNFTPKSIRKAAAVQNSPSPVKSGLPRARTILKPRGILSPKIKYPTLPLAGDLSNEVNYPTLTTSNTQNAGENTKIVSPSPGVPNAFTFRSDKTISFGESPKGFGSSPGQSSVRQVRQSILPSIPGSFPESNKENIDNLSSVPHGMANKKRRRINSDDEREDEELEHSPKKQKALLEGEVLAAPNLPTVKMSPKTRLPSPSKKPGLSLGRLNMLSRPKFRK